MSDPLRLYWWKKAPNFGDALSREITAHVSGRSVLWAPEAEADLFAIGSIMWHVRKGVERRAPPAVAPWIWGTGCMEPLRADWLPRARVAALRGPLSAGVLGLAPVPFGDPGLLAPRLTGPVPQEDIVGLIVHHGTPLPERPGFRVIDMRSTDTRAVLRQIAGCRHIVSQSLHGIIAADAYGIANTLLRPEGIHRSAWFKFLDYYASVGRPPDPGIGLADLGRLPGARPAAADRVAEMCDALIAAFPAELRARP